MIALERVTKRFGRNAETVALDDVTLRVEEGAFLLLTGASGAGKTTLLKLIFAAERPDTGKVLLFGRDISRLRRSSIPFLRRNVGVVFQDFKLLPDRTILDNVMISLEIRAMPRRIMREKAADVLTAVGLGWRLDATPRQLSAGEQQRVAIARAIVGEPAILLADEPTGNLDPDLTSEIMVLLSDVHRRGTTVVVATHDLQIMLAVERAGFPRAHLTAGSVEILMPALPGPDGENIVHFPIMVGS